MHARGPFDFDASKLSVEEVKERLRAAGIPVDSWVDNHDRVREGEDKKEKIPTLSRYAELLSQLRDVLQNQVDKDRKQIDSLRYQLHRLEHGGGR